MAKTSEKVAEAPRLWPTPTNPVPEGARVAYLETADKVRLRYATWPRGQGAPKGTICLVQGRSEYIEKYFETIADFRRRGFAVATFDWRGQGGSERLIRNRAIGHVETFDDFWVDLRSFHGSVLLPDCPAPYYLVGHSMGGLVSLTAAQRDRLMFERVFLSAPMIGLGGQPLSMGGMARLAEVLCFFGLSRVPMARAQDKPISEATFPGNALTSDINRYLRAVESIKAAPDLLIGAPSLRWVAAAMRAMADTQSDAYPGAIRIPVLMLAAARDEVVSTAATEQLGARMRNGKHLVIANARHELFQENDAIRQQVFAAFDAFVTQQSS